MSELTPYEIACLTDAVQRGLRQAKRPGKSDNVLMSARAVSKLLDLFARIEAQAHPNTPA
jgi:hypothetical protein